MQARGTRQWFPMTADMDIEKGVAIIVIVISRLIKRHLKAMSRAPAYAQALSLMTRAGKSNLCNSFSVFSLSSFCSLYGQPLRVDAALVNKMVPCA